MDLGALENSMLQVAMRTQRRNLDELALNIVNVAATDYLSRGMLFLHTVCESRGALIRQTLEYEVLLTQIGREAHASKSNPEVLGYDFLALGDRLINSSYGTLGSRKLDEVKRAVLVLDLKMFVCL